MNIKYMDIFTIALFKIKIKNISSETISLILCILNIRLD